MACEVYLGFDRDIFSFGAILYELLSGRRAFPQTVNGCRWNGPRWTGPDPQLSHPANYSSRSTANALWAEEKLNVKATKKDKKHQTRYSRTSALSSFRKP